MKDEIISFTFFRDAQFCGCWFLQQARHIKYIWQIILEELKSVSPHIIRLAQI